MKNSIPAAVSSPMLAPLPPVAPRAPIRISIAGNGLLLNGRFEHWLPVAIDGDRGAAGTVQLLVDVTSIAASSKDEPELFSFHSRRVKDVGRMMFAAKGTLHAEGKVFPVDAFIQTASKHTPFLLVTFEQVPSELPLLWQTLDESVAVKTLEAGEVHAHGWFRAPDVAAA